ncbi:MAG: TonB-dependent receptor [Pseudomonadota bacterium]
MDTADRSDGFNRVHRLRYVLASGVAMLAFTGSSWSQESGAASEQAVLEEVLVYGTKRGISIQETYDSVAVFTGAEFEEQALFKLEEVLLRSPNVTIDTNAGLRGVSLRGIYSSGLNNSGGRTINTYIDGAPLSAEGSGIVFNLWDVDQVEILLGPQATTQGRNALAGAIVAKTADPEYQFGGKVRALGASDDTWQGSAMITGPIVDDQLAYRLSYDYREEDYDGFNAVNLVDNQRNDSTQARAKLLFEPAAIAGLRAELIINYTDFFSSGNGTRVIAPDDDTPEAASFDPFDLVDYDARSGENEYENTRYILDTQYVLDDHWYLAFVGSYEDVEREITSFGAGAGVDLREDETYSMDLRFHFDYDSLTGWLGAYYFDETTEQNAGLLIDPTGFGVETTPPGITFVRNAARTRDVENWALYGDLVYRLNERWSVGIGARYDYEKLDDSGDQVDVSFSEEPCSATVGGTVTLPCSLILSSSSSDPLDTDYSAFLPRASVVYDMDESRSFSFAVSRGYRAGGVSTVGEENVEFDPEFLTNYELAFRSLWLDGDLTLNANVFFADWEDQQVRIPEGTTLNEFITLNAGESELYGAEVRLDYVFSSALDMYFALGYVETEFTDFPYAVDENQEPLPGVSGFDNLAGNEFLAAPNWTATFGAAYRSEGGLMASFNANYRGSTYSDIENLEANATDSYWQVNARLGYEWIKLKASLFVINLFDEEFFTGINRELVSFSSGEVSVVPSLVRGRNFSRPRQLGLELEYSF